MLTSVISNSSAAASSSSAAASRRASTSGGSVPRPVSLRTSSSQDGGARNTSRASGRGPPDLPRSGHVDLQQAGHARLELFLQRRARRAIPVAGEPRPLQQCPAGDQTVELAVVDKVIFAAVYFPGPRPTCRNRHGNPDARANPAEFGDDRALPDPGGPGEHGQSRMHRGRDRGFAWIWLRPVAPFSSANSCSSADRWLVPSPRTRRDSAMPSLSMICFARTLPTPGRDSSRAETFILPITSSVAPSLMTSDKVVAPRLRRFFTSARSLRARAAFSSAAARSSGVRGGRATRGHLGFRWKKVCREGKLANHMPFRQRKSPFTSSQIEIYYSM